MGDFPTARNREYFRTDQGIFLPHQGNFWRYQGKADARAIGALHSQVLSVRLGKEERDRMTLGLVVGLCIEGDVIALFEPGPGADLVEIGHW